MGGEPAGVSGGGAGGTRRGAPDGLPSARKADDGAVLLRPGPLYTVRVIAGEGTLRGDTQRARFLEAVHTGAPARLALEDGALVVTSAVRSVFRVGGDGFWLKTENTTYLVQPAGEGSA